MPVKGFWYTTRHATPTDKHQVKELIYVNLKTGVPG